MALNLVPTPIVKLGSAQVVYATPNATENIPASGQLILHVKNSGSSGTVTPQDPGFTPGGSAALQTGNAVTIQATTGDKFILLPASLINPTNGQIQVIFATGTFTAVLLSV